MPCRSGSPHAVLSPWAVLALRAGATFSRTMTARTIPTTARTSRSRFLISTSGLVTPYWRVLRTPGQDCCQGLDGGYALAMPRLQPNILLLTGVVVAAVVCWYLWRPKEAPQLLAAPLSVSYDRETTRLTAVVNL